MKKLNESGRSMIEMLGVLSIIGILTVGGYGLVSKMQRNQRMNEITDNFVNFARKVRQVSRDYYIEGETIKSMCGESACSSFADYVQYGKAYPEELTYSGGDFVDERNDVTYNVTYVGNNIMFMVSASGLDEQTCMQLATMNYGTPSTSGYMGMNIGADSSTAALASLSRQQKTIGEAVTACTGKSVVYLAFR